MANENLQGVKVAILVEDGFEQVELTEPRKALEQAGAETQIVSPKSHTVRGWNFTEWGDEFPVDVALDRTEPEDFDALHLPGGVMNPDALRMQPKAVEFIKGTEQKGLMQHRREQGIRRSMSRHIENRNSSHFLASLQICHNFRSA